MIKKAPLSFGEAAFFCLGIAPFPWTERLLILFGHDLPPDSPSRPWCS